MENLKRAMTPEWLKKRSDLPIFIQNHGTFATPVSFAHIAAISRPGVETQCSETETSKNVYRHIRLWSLCTSHGFTIVMQGNSLINIILHSQ